MNYYEELRAVIELIERYQGEYREQVSVQSYLETLLDENNYFHTKIEKHEEIKTRLQQLEIEMKRTTTIIEDLLKQKRELEKQLFLED